MPRNCSICTSSHLADVDAALLAGEPFRKIANRIGSSVSALQRHRKEHLPVAATTAAKAEGAPSAGAVLEPETGRSLLEQMRDLHARTLAILNRAEEAGQLETALRSIGQARQNMELLAKLDGELPAGGPVQVNIGMPDLSRLTADELLTLRALLAKAHGRAPVVDVTAMLPAFERPAIEGQMSQKA